MHQKILTTLAFSLAILPAMAGNHPAAQAAGAQGGGLMQASLVVSPQQAGTPRKNDVAALTGTLPHDGETSAQNTADTEHHTTTGMLLAALALMVGIVLRRWGGDEQ